MGTEICDTGKQENRGGTDDEHVEEQDEKGSEALVSEKEEEKKKEKEKEKEGRQVQAQEEEQQQEEEGARGKDTSRDE